ncbi:MAG: antitoxin [Thermoanaerobaculia bacterium]
MATRVQVVLGQEERERFRRQAEIEGKSLSCWLREAGRERLDTRRVRRIASVADLDAFFGKCDGRERGREPDWEEHRTVIERSRRSGESPT